MSESEDLEERVLLAHERNHLASERTRLAAERTISAWLRTGLATVGGGFAIVRFLTFGNINHRLMANAVGELLILWGIFIFLFALKDYRASCQNLEVAPHKNELWVSLTVLVFTLVAAFLLFVAFTQNL